MFKRQIDKLFGCHAISEVVCAGEGGEAIEGLRRKLEHFYSTCDTYAAFHDSNWKPEFWEPIKRRVLERLARSGKCSVLELGAGRTGFGQYLGDTRAAVKFDVQDITGVNASYLQGQADNVFIGEVSRIPGTATYDVVFSTFVFEHMTQPQESLSFMLELTRHGGSVFIASPRYDVPFYVPPSIRHLSLAHQLACSLWVCWQRVCTAAGGAPRFLVHLDPSVFHRPWYRDADAVHWVSIWDVQRVVPRGLSVTSQQLPVRGIRQWLWANFLLLFVEIVKPPLEPVASSSI